MSRKSMGPVLCLVGMLAAGCLAAVEGQPSGATQEAGLGTIRGLVMSEELFPVADAEIHILGLPPARSDEGGGFEVRGVTLATHTLVVNATGYEPFQQDVEVLSEAPVEVIVSLVGLPGQTPYATTIPFEGFAVCSFSAVYSAGWPGLGSAGPVPCPLGERKQTMKVEVGPDWRAGVHEMTWRTTEEMIFASSASTTERPGGASCQTSGSTHSWCPAMVWGRAPLRIVSQPNDTEYAKKYAIDGKETWQLGNYTSYIFTSYSGFARTEINATLYNQCVIINRQFNVPEHWGCPFGIGVAMGIRFQFYHTTFYLEAPLRIEDFTALPDG